MSRLFTYSLIALCAASFWSTAAVEFMAVMALVCAAVQWRDIREIFGRCRLPLILWFAYLLGYAGSVLASPHRTEISHSLLLSWHALLFPAVLLTRLTRRDLTLAAYAMLSSAAVSSVTALLYGWMQGLQVIDSPFVGVTTLADLEVLAFLGGLGLVLAQNYEQEGAVRRSLFISIALVPIAVAVCRSALKGPVFALLCGSLSLVVLLKPRALGSWMAGVFLLVLASPHVLLLKMAWFASGGHLDRYTLWQAGCSLLPHVPFAGYGPGSFARVLPAEISAAFTGQLPSTWHNDYLQTILESGWAVGIVYAAFLAAAGGRLLLLRHVERELGLTLLVVLICFVIFSTIGSVLTSSILSVIWWCTLGLIVHLSPHHSLPEFLQ